MSSRNYVLLLQEKRSQKIRLSNVEEKGPQILSSSVEPCFDNNSNHRSHRFIVATVSEISAKLEVNSSFVKVSEINGKACDMVALINTDNPVSFIKVNALLQYLESAFASVKSTETKLRNLNSH